MSITKHYTHIILNYNYNYNLFKGHCKKHGQLCNTIFPIQNTNQLIKNDNYLILFITMVIIYRVFLFFCPNPIV